jgi:hypothetical protein
MLSFAAGQGLGPVNALCYGVDGRCQASGEPGIGRFGVRGSLLLHGGRGLTSGKYQ